MTASSLCCLVLSFRYTFVSISPLFSLSIPLPQSSVEVLSFCKPHSAAHLLFSCDKLRLRKKKMKRLTIAIQRHWLKQNWCTSSSTHPNTQRGASSDGHHVLGQLRRGPGRPFVLLARMRVGLALCIGFSSLPWLRGQTILEAMCCAATSWASSCRNKRRFPRQGPVSDAKDHITVS